jgi:hypothetical protein
LGVVRTPCANPCVRQDPSTNKMDSKMIMSLEELSQILAAAGISSSQEEHILTIVKNLSTSPKDIEEPKFHEPHPRRSRKPSLITLSNLPEEIKNHGPHHGETHRT